MANTRLLLVDPFPEIRRTGMMWRCESGDEGDRECWWIVLPETHPDVGTPGHPSRISWRTTDRASDPPHDMWNVTGIPPAITVTPSIDVMRFVRGPIGPDGKQTWVREGSYWHGHITNGEIVG